MSDKNLVLYSILLAVAVLLSGATAYVSDSTNIYASLPSQIEILVPSQYESLNLQGCAPAAQATAASGVEVRSNLNWRMDMVGSTDNGHMMGSTGTPAHELHNSMKVTSSHSSGGSMDVPGSVSGPVALLTDMEPGDYSGTSIIGLTFDQPFGWNDYADDNYQLTVTLTVSPA